MILGQAGIILEGLTGPLSEDQKTRILKIKEYGEKLEKNVREYLGTLGNA